MFVKKFEPYCETGKNEQGANSIDQSFAQKHYIQCAGTQLWIHLLMCVGREGH